MFDDLSILQKILSKNLESKVANIVFIEFEHHIITPFECSLTVQY